MADYDFSQVFEEDNLFEVKNYFSGLKGYFMDDTIPTTKTSCCFSTATPPLQEDIPSPPQSAGEGFVNLYMIVDPRTGQMVCPKQMLILKNDSKTSTFFVGPSLSETINQAAAKCHQQETSVVTTPNKFMDLCSTPEPIQATSLATNVFGLYALSSPSFTTPRAYSISSSTTKEASEKRITTCSTGAGTSNAQPLRALSAYNFFFQAERDKILNGPSNENDPDTDDWSESKKQRLLEAHWNRDRTKKRRHRKSHGRISFIQLSKEISARWKRLSEERKEFYREVAALDFARFHQGNE